MKENQPNTRLHLFSESGKSAYNAMAGYKQNYRQEPTLEWLQAICGQAAPEQNHALEFLYEQLEMQFMQFRIQSIAENARLISDNDPKEAYRYIQEESRKLNLHLSVTNQKKILKFSDYLIRLERMRSQEVEKVIKTVCEFGFNILDQQTQGLCAGDFCLIVAQTNEGKSWMTKKIVTNVCTRQGKRVLLLLLEEDCEIGMYTLDSIYAETASVEYMQGTLTEEEKTRIFDKFMEYHVQEKKGETIVPDARSLLRCGSMVQICQMVDEFSIDLVIIDQITLLSKTLMYEDMSRMALDIKTAARLMGIPIIGVSQAKSSPKALIDVGYEVVAHGEEITRNADTALYLAPESQCTEIGVKLIKLIKTRRGTKNIITRNKWDLGFSCIEELGMYEIDQTLQSNNRQKSKSESYSNNRTDNKPVSNNKFSWAQL